jgi:hypothetical protein
MSDEKTREDRLRRQLDRRGYLLRKSRSPVQALDHGLYVIVDAKLNVPVTYGFFGTPYGLDLDEVETWIADHDAELAAA